jgi:hypothetical protein
MEKSGVIDGKTESSEMAVVAGRCREAVLAADRIVSDWVIRIGDVGSRRGKGRTRSWAGSGGLLMLLGSWLARHLNGVNSKFN